MTIFGILAKIWNFKTFNLTPIKQIKCYFIIFVMILIFFSLIPDEIVYEIPVHEFCPLPLGFGDITLSIYICVYNHT